MLWDYVSLDYNSFLLVPIAWVKITNDEVAL